MLGVPDIEVAISSAQITGAVGTLVLILLAVIGWFLRSEWRGIKDALSDLNLRLGRIELNTAALTGYETRIKLLESRLDVVSRRGHKFANVLAVLMHKADMKQIDFDAED